LLLVDLQKRVLLGERSFNFCEEQIWRMQSYSLKLLDEEAANDFLQTWPWPNGDCTSASPGAAASELSDAPADGQAESRADARAEARAGASTDAPANDDGAAGGYSPVPDAALPRRLYAVKFQSMGSGTTEAEAEVSAIELLLADHCVPSVLEETHLTHICCTTWCTCLIFRRWGLPCAHMFWCMFAENLVCVPNEWCIAAGSPTTLSAQRTSLGCAALRSRKAHSCTTSRSGATNSLRMSATTT
jgi:hypothetical protein